MKHYINEIDNRTADSEDTIIISEPWKSIDLDVPIKIEKFPAEFKKNIYKTIDIRFLLILLFSVVLNVGTILILEKFVPTEMTNKTITRIQERYAKILLKTEIPTPSYFEERSKSNYLLDTEVITGLNRWMDVFTNDILETIKEAPAFNKPVAPAGSKETKAPSKEELGAARKSATANRMTSREDLEKEVNSVGLLGLISSNTRSIDNEYVQDLLEYASENSTHLTEVLARLNSIEVPRYGNSGYLKKIRQNDANDESVALKGGRATATDEIKQVIENVEPIEAVETKPMKRNLNYEEVPEGDISKLTDAMTRAKTRSTQDVLRIVQSHTRALQDCYKQELRYDPGISGKIIVRFIIDVDGNVKDASIVTSTLNSPRMEECILNRIKRWRNFPSCDPSVGDKTYRQSFSFGENNK